MESSIQQIETPVSLDELDAMEDSMQNNLKRSLGSSNLECSIYKVPEFIRRGNEEYYQPSVISIGPVFRNDSQVQTIQQLKWIYLDSFLKIHKTADRSLKHYINIVKEMKEKIKECYEDPSMTSCSNDDEFAEMIVLDAVFLLCLFAGSDIPISVPIPSKLKALKTFIISDIFILENQIPYFVLDRIFDEAFPEPPFSLVEYTHRYINRSGIPGAQAEPIAGTSMTSNGIRHLLDFWWKSCRLSFDSRRKQAEQVVVTRNQSGRRKCCLLSFNAQQREEKLVECPETAKQLSAAGVAFKKGDTKNPLWITFNSSNGEFHIPKIHVYDGTEKVMRSMLLFEQCHYFHEGLTYFSDWVILFTSLIENVQDIQILQQAGVLENDMGSDEALFDFSRNVNKNAIYSIPFNYSRFSREVNTYANKPWNGWKAILRREYFKHPWAIISFIFAVILFILTVIQTITGFKKN